MTTTVSTVVHHLLMEEEQVSLPGIGTLQLLPQPATVNSIQGQLAPPAELVTFNSNLVLDDGRILRALQQHGDLDEPAARRLLDEFLRNMRENLDAGRSFTIDEVGRFNQPTGDRIVFSPAGGNFSKDSYGLPTVSLRPIVRTERQVRDAVDPLATGTVTPPRAAKSGLLYNDQLRRYLWILCLALAAFLVLAALYRVWQYNNSTPGAGDDVVRIEREDPPPRLPRDRVNVAPGPKPPPVDADRVAPDPPPRLSDPDPVDVITPSPTDPAPNINDPVVSPTPATTGDNVALIATGMFGSQRNVDKNLGRIEAAGFETFARPEGRLTRIGVRLVYSTDEELFTALERIRRLYSDSFVMEINGEAQRIE